MVVANLSANLGVGQVAQNAPVVLSIIDIDRPFGAKVIYLSQPTSLNITVSPDTTNIKLFYLGASLDNPKALPSSAEIVLTSASITGAKAIL